jgi:hypothetical protein
VEVIRLYAGTHLRGVCAMGKVSFSDGIGVAGIALAILLVVLDKAGKLKGGWLYGLLFLAGLMTLFIALGNVWVTDAPARWRIWRTLLMACFVGFAYSALAIWINPAKDSQIENGSNTSTGAKCSVIPQQLTPNIHPSPDEASDQQLLRASLAVQISVLNLKTVDLNAQIKAKHEKTEDKSEERLCAILQEYENSIRIPAQIVRQTFLKRLPPEERVLSKTAAIDDAYQHPQSIQALSMVMDDLSRLSEPLERVNGVKQDDNPNNDWIISPLPRFTPSEPLNESDFFLVQQHSANGYVAKLMDMNISFGSPVPVRRPASGRVIVVLERKKGWSGEERVRVVFNSPINEWGLGYSAGQYTLGKNFVEFITNGWNDTESAQLDINGAIRIKRLFVVRP